MVAADQQVKQPIGLGDSISDIEVGSSFNQKNITVNLNDSVREYHSIHHEEIEI
jgi:hypothetical protein